jgi:hypothetical protein
MYIVIYYYLSLLLLLINKLFFYTIHPEHVKNSMIVKNKNRTVEACRHDKLI